MRFLIIIPGSALLLIVIFFIGVTRTPPNPDTLYPAPETAQEFLKRGELYKDAQAYDRALADYQQATALDPDNSSARLGLGASLSALGRHEEAIEQYQQVRQLDLQNDISTRLVDSLIESEQQALETP